MVGKITTLDNESMNGFGKVSSSDSRSMVYNLWPSSSSSGRINTRISIKGQDGNAVGVENK